MTSAEILAFLPEEKKQQILLAKDLILEKVPDVEKIFLFGSYAKGKWVEDRFFENGVLYEYLSDYDFLVVTGEPIGLMNEYLYQDKIVNSWRHKIPINPHVQDFKDVNDGLEMGQYFFIEILKDGILLFDRNKRKLSKPKLLSESQIRDSAQKKFHKWYQGGQRILKYAKLGLDESLAQHEDLKDIAFLLHQAAERFFGCVLLVFGNYKPKTHNLSKLREYVKIYSKDLYHLFSPLPENPQETYLFNLLKNSYIDARYKEDFQISETDINLLIKKIEKMAEIVDNVCRPKII